MRRGICLLRPDPAYRADGFRAGMKRAGLAVQTEVPAQWRESDVLVVWNRYGSWHAHACAAERAGATVLVAENGYLGREWNGSTWYALSRNWHNGRGTWDPGDGSRWAEIGCELLPWQNDVNGPVLILPQRGFGPPEQAMPESWLAAASNRLKSLGIPYRVRQHPGNIPAAIALEDDRRGCYAIMTWGSGAAIKALALGYPVHSDWPQWIGYPAKKGGDAARLAMFERLAWAMWSIEELQSGGPIARLIQ